MKRKLFQLAGKSFNKFLFQHKKSLPKQLNYTIRLPQYFDLGTIYPYFTLSKRVHDKTNATYSNYYESCFLTIQNNIERAFIQMQSTKDEPQPTSLRRFPYPSVNYDFFLESFAADIFPFFIVIAFLYTTKVIIKVAYILADKNRYSSSTVFIFFHQNVATERESQMKETMKIMGLTSLHYWLAWFAKCFLMISVAITFFVIFLTVICV